MVAMRSCLLLSAVATVAIAGKCKPESSASQSVSLSLTVSAGSTTETTPVDSTTLAPSTTLTDSTTTLTDITIDTSIVETSAETSTEAAITHSVPTTFATSFTVSSEETTTAESATTTTAAAPATLTCPSDLQQCFNGMQIQCDVILIGLAETIVSVDDLEHCARVCDRDSSCVGFTWDENDKACYPAISQVPSTAFQGWVSGLKGTC
ncbi:hypothetical protein FLONG3_1609 [Fusarium longipes]|uniref:Apple domain-containing protein n=1 Tax=Fusarium longipes TaxID=694270 RepID=A0A395T6G5_9HYPO|nr:hypothetical protein FLONG3_1609 [Fusarium longipes]